MEPEVLSHTPLSRLNPIRFLTPIFLRFIVISSRLYLYVPRDVFPITISNRNVAWIQIWPVHAICYAHLIIIDILTVTVLGEVYKFLDFLLSVMPNVNEIYKFPG
jgi:hypothetical protein